MMTPSSMNTSWSATSRANPISWVTTTIVMPSSASFFITREHLADELRVQRRGGLVEQHQLGVHRQGPGDRDTLLLAAGQLRRIRGGLFRQPHLIQQIRCPCHSIRLLDALHVDRRLDDVLQRRAVREQVEVLEHHADVAALLGGVTGRHLEQLVPRSR